MNYSRRATMIKVLETSRALLALLAIMEVASGYQPTTTEGSTISPLGKSPRIKMFHLIPPFSSSTFVNII